MSRFPKLPFNGIQICIAPSTTSAERAMASMSGVPFDRESAEFISILMFVAKSLEQVRNTSDLPLEAALLVALEAQANVLTEADELYPEAGQMERQVIAFAERMGFSISQQHLSLQSHVVH